MLRPKTGYTMVIVAVLLGATFSQGLSAAKGPAQQDCRTFAETGQTVCGRFLEYWNTHGGLAQQGYPISGELQEVSELDNKSYTVQYFERAVFEYHPENSVPNDVLLSQLGTFRYKQKYKGAAAPERVTPKEWQLTEKAEIKPGIWMVFYVAEVSGSYITFRGTIHNDSGAVFNLRMDKQSTTISDSTGRVYDLYKLDIGGAPDIAPGDYHNLVMSATFFSPPKPEAKYLALNIYNLSGLGPFIFYRNF